MSRHTIIIDLDNCMFDTHGTEGPKGCFYPEVREVIASIADKHKLVLLTFSNNRSRQWEKIMSGDVAHFFWMIDIVEEGAGKFPVMDALKRIPSPHGSKSIIVVGDRLDQEILHANVLGYTSVRVRRGKYRTLEPKSQYQAPEHTITNFRELLPILQ